MEDKPPVKLPSDDQDRESDEKQEDFAALLEAAESSMDHAIQRDNKITGTIVSIGEEWVFVDVGTKSEGAIARDELMGKDGCLTVKVGDTIEAYVLDRREGEILLSVKMTAAASEEAMRGAYRSGVPVDGLVTGERKGGYSVRVFGKDAFCPYSQMDLRPRGNREDYLDQRFAFRITEYSEKGRNIVLSRRAILEEEKARQLDNLRRTMEPGDIMGGTVSNVTDFGAFVDIGGTEGLIPMSELAWYRVEKASQVLSPGDPVTVKVLNVDWDSNRITLSLKQTLEDPWLNAANKYPEGATHEGRVTKLAAFGAFVELEPGIEGLIHISNLGAGKRINHPREVVTENEQVSVTVLSVDQQARRIGLEMRFPASETEETPAVELTKGAVVMGTVDAVKDYGVFVAFPGGKSGLLHVSQIPGGSRGDLRKRFQVGSPIEVEILEIDAATNRIALSTTTLDKRSEQSQFKQFVSGGEAKTGGLGTLGDILKDKLKK